MDVDTLVRHDLPVVMVMGNNSAWALEKGPMQMLYGYDVIADLAPRTPYDEVVRGARRRRRDRHRPERDRPGHRPGLRQRRALPRQRDHRRRRPATRGPRSASEPAMHIRRARQEDYAAVGDVTVAAYEPIGWQGDETPTPSSCATPRRATARPSCSSRSTPTTGRCSAR